MTTTQTRSAVAGEVRAALARSGRSQADLAEAIGVSRSAMSKKLRGVTSFHIEEVLLIASALNIDVASLIPASSAALAA